MQNRGALWIFTILLALACVYQLSFSLFTGRIERDARSAAEQRADSVMSASGAPARMDRDSLILGFENAYLRERAEDRVYPLLGYTYRECKEKEINLGLDLKGGMAVTLEVSIPELVENLSENSDDASFRTAMENARKRMISSDADFITLFEQEYNKIGERGPLSAVFYTPERDGMFDRDGSDADYIAALRKEADVALNNTEKILRTRIDKFGVAQPSIQKQPFSGRIMIELPGVKDKERVRRVLQSTANLEFWETFENAEIHQYLNDANERLASVLSPELAAKADAEETDEDADVPSVDADADADLVADDTTSTDTIAAADELDPNSAEARAKARKENPLFSVLTPSVYALDDGRFNLTPGPVIGYARLSDTAQVKVYLANPAVAGALPSDVKLSWAAKPRAIDTGVETIQVLDIYALRVPVGGKPLLDGSSIVNAAQDFDMKGAVEVTMQMNPEGAQIWKVMTGDNVGKSIAIVLDELVYSAPTVRGEIPGGRSSITLGTGDINKQIQEADDLANILKAGALPAPARIIEETIVGPTLGEENVKTGLYSFGIALLLVLVYMVIYYAGAGWVADLALVVNLFVLIGSLASLQAALTLPGIAGIVLTMGMAVDANVLIYERIREELRAGKMMKSAVDLGYKGAYSAIIDSNVTTLIVAVILYLFGSGPIKGFATTLGLGILTSLFTALFLSRMIITWRLEQGKSFSVWNNWSSKVFVNANYQFMAKRKTFYVISAVIIGAGIVSMFTNNFNWGVDFSGGRTYVVKFDDAVRVEDVRAALAPNFRAEDGTQNTVNVKSYGGARQVKITTNYMWEATGVEVDELVDGQLTKGLAELKNPYQLVESRKVSPTISDDIKVNAMTSLTLALAFIFLYIALRFRNWQYGLAGLLSLLHDALIMLGLYSILWKVMPFSMEIDDAFIAAILTVIGYSINDTVVVFDRIREYLADHKREPHEVVINKAINATLGRTMNTSLTTLMVLLIIFVFGGVAIKGFIFALLIGILVGTYSSVFVASSLVVDLLKNKYADRAA
ncbi:MAG: protein translocase subunit SecDF [Flavobacteriales bacterium]|nr:protein translocase subunit SecDF [Flavobacteriales bacterium]